jgi:uncharacterized spore protein YtfJ
MAVRNRSERRVEIMNVTMDQVKDVFDGVRDSFTVSRVFGEPISKDGVMIVPATRIAAGGGGGGGSDGSHDRSAVDSGPDVAGGLGMGFGGVSKPAGAFVFKDGDVRWVPIVNRDLLAVLRAAILALSLLTARSIVRRVCECR